MSSIRPIAARLALISIAVLSGAASLPAAQEVHTPESLPQLHYELEFVPGGGERFPLERRPEWRLRVTAEGLKPEAGAATFVFNSWGNWRELDSLYLDITATTPAIDAHLFPGNAVVLLQPEKWDGRVEIEFVLQPLYKGSEAQRRYGLLPVWATDYSFGQSRNVFPKLYQDAGQTPCDITVELKAPAGCPVASSWGGIGEASQRLAVDPTEGNALLCFGTPLGKEQLEVEDRRLEILQYGRAVDVTRSVSETMQQLAGSIAATTGRPAPDPMVVFITDVGGGGMGADPGLVLGYTEDTPEWQQHTGYYKHFVAHEFFHTWLGGMLEGSENMTWFHEGFTEYFSLWHAASAGVIPHEWFAERIYELGKQAREESAWGRVAFGDTSVVWRDGDGENETMAYKGGATLAFALDVTLRKKGRSGAIQMIRDFLARDIENATLGDLEAWCTEQGVKDFWKEFVMETNTLDVLDYLEQIGFKREGEGDEVRFTVSKRKLAPFFRFKAANR